MGSLKRWIGVFAALCMVAVLAHVAYGQEEMAGRGKDAGAGAVVTNAAEVGTPGDGSADAAEQVTEVMGSVSLVKRLKSGGSTMIYLGLLSVAGVAFALERTFMLRRSVIVPDGVLAQAMELWRRQRFEEVAGLAETRPSVLSRILAAFVRHRHCAALELSQLAGDIAGREMRSHLQRAYPIAVVATLSPLLGLLGTVIGMIESFEIVAIAGSLGDASLLAGSISKALITTAAGLIIAVPALALYHLFKSRTAALSSLLEEQVNEALTTWFMDDISRTS